MVHFLINASLFDSPSVNASVVFRKRYSSVLLGLKNIPSMMKESQTETKIECSVLVVMFRSHKSGFPKLAVMGTLWPFINSLVYPPNSHILFWKKNSFYQPKTLLENQKNVFSATRIGFCHRIRLKTKKKSSPPRIFAIWCQRVYPTI